MEMVWICPSIFVIGHLRRYSESETRTVRKAIMNTEVHAFVNGLFHLLSLLTIQLLGVCSDIPGNFEPEA